MAVSGKEEEEEEAGLFETLSLFLAQDLPRQAKLQPQIVVLHGRGCRADQSGERSSSQLSESEQKISARNQEIF